MSGYDISMSKVEEWLLLQHGSEVGDPLSMLILRSRISSAWDLIHRDAFPTPRIVHGARDLEGLEFHHNTGSGVSPPSLAASFGCLFQVSNLRMMQSNG